MKTFIFALLVASSTAIVQKSAIMSPTGMEVLCQNKRDGHLNIDKDFFGDKKASSKEEAQDKAAAEKDAPQPKNAEDKKSEGMKKKDSGAADLVNSDV